MHYTKETLLKAFGEAVQRHEGYYAPDQASPKGSRSWRNNSPGNLKWIGQRGSVGKDAQGFAIFPDYATGFHALVEDLRYKMDVRKLDTVYDIIARFAPPNENNTNLYAMNVAAELNVGMNYKLSGLLAPHFEEIPVGGKEVRIKLVANRAAWTTLPDKIQELQDWFTSHSGGKIKLLVDVEYTDFASVPFVPYPGNEFMDGVDFQWYDQMISPKGKGYHIVLFLMNKADWKGKNARGWRTDALPFGCVELQVSADENEEIYFRGSQNFYLINAFVNYAEHEIMHALYMMQGSTWNSDGSVHIPGADNTHWWYDRGELSKAFDEINVEYLDRLLEGAKLGEFRHTFRIPMWFGMKANEEVKALQKALQVEGLMPPGSPSGNYYSLTQAAVKAFQEKYRVASWLELAFVRGRRVGPKTLRKLSELYS